MVSKYHYNTNKTEKSRIIDYGIGTEEELNELKELLKITNVEKSEDLNAKVKYSVILGQNYK